MAGSCARGGSPDASSLLTFPDNSLEWKIATGIRCARKKKATVSSQSFLLWNRHVEGSDLIEGDAAEMSKGGKKGGRACCAWEHTGWAL